MTKPKELDNILDECLERILTKGETLEQCLANYPEQAAELEPLLQTALLMKKVTTLKPRPEFRERARYQWRGALQEMVTKREHRFCFFAWRPQWATVVIAVLIFVLAGGSTVAAAGNSMPDEPLYPVKLATETVRLALTPSPLGKAELYVRLTDKRVAEIINMAHKGKPEQVARITQRLNRQLMVMASLAVLGEEETTVMPTPAPRQAQAPTEEKGPAVMKTPTPAAPGSTGDETIKLDRRAKLRKLVARNAIEHPEALRAALKKVPESARLALLQAIASSDSEYQKVLKALKVKDKE